MPPNLMYRTSEKNAHQTDMKKFTLTKNLYSNEYFIKSTVASVDSRLGQSKFKSRKFYPKRHFVFGYR